MKTTPKRDTSSDSDAVVESPSVPISKVVLQAGVFGGETVAVIFNREVLAQVRVDHVNVVVYALPEIPVVRDLRVHAPTALRVVHELKREFDGWIDPKGYEVTHND